jgi:hypothetical protein
MTGKENAGKRAFQTDLFKADLDIGFTLIRSARSGYETGQDRVADRNLECARDAYSDAARLFGRIAGPDIREFEPDLTKLRNEIEATERFRRHGWLRVRAIYN